MRVNMRLSGLPILLVSVVACRGRGARETEFNPLSAPSVDSARVPSVETTLGWGYRQQTAADLDGDDQPEQITLTADVSLGPNRLPLWEDGHRWALYVESAGRRPTLLYAAFVPNGFVESAILQADQNGRRRVLVQERTPAQLRSLEVEYDAGTARLSSAAYYQIQQWIPGSASMP
jgi:hypothetical protein